MPLSFLALGCILLPAVAAPATPPPVVEPIAGTEDEVTWGPWYVLMPVAPAKGASAVKGKLPPEKELQTMRPNRVGPDLQRTWKGKRDRTIGWRLVRSGAGSWGAARESPPTVEYALQVRERTR